MKTIEVTCGQTIEAAARKLCAAAPAKADFNGVTVRARYATTRPEDVAKEYWRRSQARSVMWSPERTAREARWAAEQKATRERIAAECAALPSIDWTTHDAPLAWVERVADETIPNAADVASVFREHGYMANACTEGAYNGEDPDNAGRYIIGQAIANLDRWGGIHPMCGEFVRRWRERFPVTVAA